MSIRGFLPMLVACVALTFAGCNEPGASGANGEDGADGADAVAGQDGADGEGAATAGSDATNTPDETTASAQPAEDAATIALSPDNTTITFVGTKDDGRHDGGFRQLEGTLAVSGDSVEGISVTAKTESLWADNPKLEGHLKHRDFFEVEAHPELSFASTQIKPADDEGTHTITGDLTMLGQTHSIDVPATIELSGDKVNLTSDFTIDRTQWGMNYNPDQVHKDVQISVKIDASK
jgi:polyisoprenoid-binding protein YceI